MANDQDTFVQELAGTTGDPNIVDTKKYVAISQVNIYEFMSMSFDGNGYYRDGQYLVPHSREMFYRTRRALAFYRNYVKPITRATYQPVFGEKVTRTIDPEGGLFASFVDDVDNAGTSLQEFMENVIKLARLHGVTFIVMENFPIEDQPLTIRDAQESRVFPYMYVKQAQTVDDYKADRFGNIEWIAFLEKVVKNTTGQPEKIYRIWTSSESILAKKRNKHSTKKMTGLEQYEPLERVTHDLGMVPVIPVFSNRPDSMSCLLADPPLYDIARVNHAIYNKDSEVRDLERNQGFSILCVQGDIGGDQTIGSVNGLMVPEDVTNMPQYISPDPTILKGLTENVNALRDDLFRMAEQMGVVGVKTEASGVALGYRFFAHESVLKFSSWLTADTEEKVSRMFSLYTGESVTMTTDWPTDFQPIDTGNEARQLDDYLQQTDLTIEARTLAHQKYSRLILGDQDPDRVSEVVTSFDVQAEEKQQAAAAGGGDSEISLNGIQIRSLLDIATKVGTGELTMEAGAATITSTLPISAETAVTILEGASAPVIPEE